MPPAFEWTGRGRILIVNDDTAEAEAQSALAALSDNTITRIHVTEADVVPAHDRVTPQNSPVAAGLAEYPDTEIVLGVGRTGRLLVRDALAGSKRVLGLTELDQVMRVLAGANVPVGAHATRLAMPTAAADAILDAAEQLEVPAPQAAVISDLATGWAHPVAVEVQKLRGEPTFAITSGGCAQPSDLVVTDLDLRGRTINRLGRVLQHVQVALVATADSDWGGGLLEVLPAACRVRRLHYLPDGSHQPCLIPLADRVGPWLPMIVPPGLRSASNSSSSAAQIVHLADDEVLPTADGRNADQRQCRSDVPAPDNEGAASVADTAEHVARRVVKWGELDQRIRPLLAADCSVIADTRREPLPSLPILIALANGAIWVVEHEPLLTRPQVPVVQASEVGAASALAAAELVLSDPERWLDQRSTGRDYAQRWHSGTQTREALVEILAGGD